MLRSLVRRLCTSVNLEVTTISSRLEDVSPDVLRVVKRARPFTMTSLERLAALCEAVRYAALNKIPGAFVECGVWKGGSSMAAAMSYLGMGKTDIDMFLFDTFEGMPEPGEKDFLASSGELARDLLAASKSADGVKAYAPIEEVRRNLESTGYPAEHLHFIKGMVEETIPASAPNEISVLRLDTDWYISTKHEMGHLFPRLANNGVLIIDDYGYWGGARAAVDEYFAENDVKPLLNRIDSTGRICIKT